MGRNGVQGPGCTQRGRLVVLNWGGVLKDIQALFCPKDFRFSCSSSGSSFAGRGGLPDRCPPVPIVVRVLLSSEARGAQPSHLPLLSLCSWCRQALLQGCRSGRTFSLWDELHLYAEGGRWRREYSHPLQLREQEGCLTSARDLRERGCHLSGSSLPRAILRQVQNDVKGQEACV